MQNSIILIGMPGCGKSTCGVLAAKALCKSFADTDLLIQAAEGAGLQTILNTQGPDYFALAEERILCGFHESNCVVATGGSAVYYEQAMTHLRELGTVIYLKISFEEMCSRISNITTRGILLRDGETLEDMFRAREQRYEEYADIILDCDTLSVEQAVSAICSAVSE